MRTILSRASVALLICIGHWQAPSRAQESALITSIDSAVELHGLSVNHLSAAIQGYKAKLDLLMKLSRELEDQHQMTLDKYERSTVILFEEATRSQTSNLPTASIEINHQLIANCLNELQRLQWEQAAAAAEMEEAEPIVQDPESRLQIQRVQAQVELAKADLETNIKLLNVLQEQSKAAVIPISEVSKQAAVVDRLKIQISNLERELLSLKELQTAESRMAIQSAKKRLAEAKSRETVVQKQLKELQSRELQLKRFAIQERALDKMLERASVIEQQIFPLKMKTIENQVLLERYEAQLAQQLKENKASNAEKPAPESK